ncbi:hypothetical protein HEB94_000192 [Actinopolymorpha pittospori]|uniref:Uncharacterized protein n=1 Tax=Actinopolymorpha pittospori TaxID=648752 RepID=A0A927MNW1_9ACTN|nr:hypothetical protein [Actinopolymorpha pittospori]
MADPELIQRIQASDTTTGTLESLHATVADLCCQSAGAGAGGLFAQRFWERHRRRFSAELGSVLQDEAAAYPVILAAFLGCLRPHRGDYDSPGSVQDVVEPAAASRVLVSVPPTGPRAQGRAPSAASHRRRRPST